MENPFKQLLCKEKLPKMLKKKVMNDISFINLTIDVADLLTIKYPEAIEEILNLKNKK